MNHRCWKLSPSDLTFLWDECARCFYLKNVHGVARPRGIMPAIFNQIDAKMKACYLNSRTEEISPALPADRCAMKIANSLKTLKKRDKNCRVVRRKGRVYVINKTQRRFKAKGNARQHRDGQRKRKHACINAHFRQPWNTRRAKSPNQLHAPRPNRTVSTFRTDSFARE